jgi:predicted PurR-regulated permease PerM
MNTHDTLTVLARGILLIVAALIIAGLYLAQDVLIPLVLAGLFCFLLSPIVNRLETWRIARVPAVLLTTLLAFALIGALAYVVAGQLLDLAYQLPSYKENMRAKIAALQVPSEGP